MARMEGVEWTLARVSSLTSHASKRNTDALSSGAVVKGTDSQGVRGPCFSFRELLSPDSTRDFFGCVSFDGGWSSYGAS